MTAGSRRRGLGKGLNELLAATMGLEADVSVTEPGTEGSVTASEGVGTQPLVELAVECIKPGPFQPRNTMTQNGLEQLADSIKLQGVIQPIVVRFKGEGIYEILAGERRWRASQLAGLNKIPVVIKNVSDEVAMAIGLIENIQREDLNPVEQAKALKRLSDNLQLTHLQVAEMLGKSRASITNSMRLLSLNPDVSLMVEQGALEMGHARALLGLQGPLQSQVAKTVTKRSMSVRETERVVLKLQEGLVQGKLVRRSVDPDIRRLEQDLADKLGASVAIRHTQKGRGTLVIHYSSTEELDGILAHIIPADS